MARSLGLALLVIAGLASCVDAPELNCASLLCPDTLVCSEVHARCVTREQVAACEGLADEASCQLAGVGAGACDQGVCFTVGCGNGFEEPGEVCDDGNIADGDGCSADCQSDETCGNGIVDPQVGELCDDGNQLSGDGCQENCSLPTCGDGVTDEGEVCDDGNDVSGDGCNPLCSSNETCGNGVIDVVAGEECDDGALATGDGCGATCQIEVCGNNIMDPGELCDDGNIVSGDGCSANCGSDESCGNGLTDPATGEQCDDGNFRSRDGCSSGCTVEIPFWEEVTPGPPEERFGMHLVYDSGRQRFVLFGGFGESSPTNDTWEYDGTQWQQVITENAPSPRGDYALAYDPKNRVTVLFGGSNASGVLGDTWTYDGRNWQLQSPPVSPSARAGAAMAYHGTQQRVVLFGGITGIGGGGSFRGDTWFWNGTNWAPLGPATSPPARSHSSMAYEPETELLILYGGDGANQQTWLWTGSAWFRNLGGSIPNQQRGVLAYQTGFNDVVFHSEGLPGATWRWNGNGWEEVSDITSLPPRQDFAMAGNPKTGELLMFGGFNNGSPLEDSWSFGTAWSPANAQSAPSARNRAAASYDSTRGQAVLYGGSFIDVDFNDTWRYDGLNWALLGPKSNPGLADDHGMAYDSARDRTILVRAIVSNFETWEFDGEEWESRGAAGLAHEPRGAALVYDAARARTVLFGGASGAETWQYDGTTWTQLVTANAPSGIFRPSMVYDSERDLIILFGGAVSDAQGAATRAETWVLDLGAATPDWSQVVTPNSPDARFGAAMTFHQALGRAVLFGGDSGSSLLADTWEFDGSDWAELSTPISPSARFATLGFYDARRRVTVVHGTNPLTDTWEFAYISGFPDELCTDGADNDGDGLDDCADPDCDAVTCGNNGEQCVAGGCVCAGGATESVCANGFDDDCDGMLDCDDPDCAGDVFCTGESDCTDGIDNDADGVTDCGDPGCVGQAFCEPFEASCGDGEDNDGDGLIDCGDPDCYLVPCTAIN